MIKRSWGRILLSGASLAAMGALSPAVAQDTQVSDEIVVTATGRAAAIQDVPLAITALGHDALENAGVDNLMDVEQLAPSIRIYAGQSTVTGTIVRVRGIGTGADNPGFESAVGIFIDGVYRARSGVAMSELPELERVEVLRGPQGTLFGRNTSAGAVSIVTSGPDFTTGAWMQATAGDLGLAAARVGMTGAVIEDTLALRFDGSLRARDGYITDSISGNDINTQNRWTARGQALWDISDDATLRIIVDRAETDEVCCAVTPITYGQTQGAIQLLRGPSSTPPLNPEGRSLTVTPGRDYREAVEDWGVSSQLDWDLGSVNLTSITAYRDWDAIRNQDVDFSVIDIGYRDGLTIAFETFTQEIRLQGEWGRVNWLVGAFYGDEKLDTTDRIRLGADVNNYINVLTQGGTAALTTVPHPLLGGISGPAVTGPFEFFDSSGLNDDNPQIDQAGNPQAPGTPQDPVESIFYFAGLGGFNPFPNAPPLATSNALLQNAYLTPGPSGVGQVADAWSVDTQSLAVFTHNEIALSDALTLTIGLRYSSETKDLDANLNAVNPTCLSMQGLEAATEASVPGPGGIVSALAGSSASIGTLVTFACNPAVNPIANGVRSTDREENEFSGTTSLSYHVSEDMMIYGGYSRGYKSGGFNVDRSGLPILPWQTSAAGINLASLGFEPEFTDAYELGVKSTLFGGTTDLNVNLFYQLITDYQNNSFNGTNFITRNVPETVSQGVEVDFLSRPTDQLTLQGGMLYNDAYYDSTVVYATTPGNTIFAGDPLDHAPEWSFTGAVTYEQPISDTLSAKFYLDGRWNSEYRNQTLSRDPVTDQEAFAVFNGAVSLGSPTDNWSVELWGRNLADEYYTVGAFQATFQSGTFVVYPGEPRTYGVTVRARY